VDIHASKQGLKQMFNIVRPFSKIVKIPYGWSQRNCLI